jgi:hypothetical protein
MNQPIAGVAPPEQGEVPSMTVWPSIAATPAGRWVGQLASIQWGLGRSFTLGRLLALAASPIALAVYAWKRLPYVCRRYCLTNRRVVVQKGLSAVDGRSIGLDEFDAIEILTLPGQKWLRAGEMLFVRDGHEVFRLSGVPLPESFRQACLKARTALVSVRHVLRQQAVASGQ